jgi:hypothetical protein
MRPARAKPRTLQVIQSPERAGFRKDVHPALIGGSLAEIAEIRPPRPPPAMMVPAPG